MRRINFIGGVFSGLLVVGSMIVGGCGDRQEKTVIKPVENVDSQEVNSAGAVRIHAPATEGFTVSVLPNRPTVKDDLRLVYSGAKVISSCYWELNGIHIEPSDFECLPSNTFAKGDEIKVRVTSGGVEATTSVTIANAPPEVVAVPFKESRIHRGVDIEVMPEGADVDGDPVRYRYVWTINDEELSIDSPVLSGDSFHKGDRISLSVIPYDDEDTGRVYRGREFVIPNAPPNFISSPPLQFKAGTYHYTATAEDADGDTLSYFLELAPAGMSIDSGTGQVVWPVGKVQSGERHKVIIVAEDDEGAKAFQEYDVTISHEE